VRPVFFSLPIPYFGYIPIFSYEALRALGAIIGFIIVANRGKRLGLNPSRVLTASFWGLTFAFISARIFYVIQYYLYYHKHPIEIFKIWGGGSVYYGGLIGGFIFLLFYCRKTGLNVWKYFDTIAPAIALGIAFARIGCFLAGCCYGTTSLLPWAVHYPKGSGPYKGQIEGLILTPGSPYSLPVHPVQLYEAIGCLLIMIIIIYDSKKLFDGQNFFNFVGLYAILRFILEYFRADADRGYFIVPYVSVSQGISLLLLLFLFVVYTIKLRDKTKELGKVTFLS